MQTSHNRFPNQRTLWTQRNKKTSKLQRNWPKVSCTIRWTETGKKHFAHSGDSMSTHQSQVLWLLLGPSSGSQPLMPTMQFHVTNERGTYLCTTRALVFEGSILMYNPTLNGAKWIPMRGLANDLSWAEERSVVPWPTTYHMPQRRQKE